MPAILKVCAGIPAPTRFEKGCGARLAEGQSFTSNAKRIAGMAPSHKVTHAIRIPGMVRSTQA